MRVLIFAFQIIHFTCLSINHAGGGRGRIGYEWERRGMRNHLYQCMCGQESHFEIKKIYIKFSPLFFFKPHSFNWRSRTFPNGLNERNHAHTRMRACKQFACERVQKGGTTLQAHPWGGGGSHGRFIYMPPLETGIEVFLEMNR